MSESEWCGIRKSEAYNDIRVPLLGLGVIVCGSAAESVGASLRIVSMYGLSVLRSEGIRRQQSG